MSRYAQVDRSMWVDEKFLTLSAPKPNAQTLFVWLLTSPDASIIPGTYRIGLAGIAESLGWSNKTTSALLSELERAGMVRADLKARLVWLPNALKRNAPKGPDNLSPWEKAWQELPECALKAEVWQAAWDHFSERDPKFVERFEALCPHPLARPQAPPMPPPMPPPMGSASQAESRTHSRHTNNKILNPNLEQEQEQPKPMAPAQRLSEPEQAVLDALGQWPPFAPLANLDWVRATLATAATRGWSAADVATGVAEAGEKKSGAFAVAGTPDVAGLSDIVTGFIRNAHTRRRAGGSMAPATHAGWGSQGSPTQSPPRTDLKLVQDEPEIVPAPLDDPARLAFLRALSGMSGAG